MIVSLIIAGAIGTLGRFVIDGEIRRKLGREFPWGTFIINVGGCLILGFLTGLVVNNNLDSSTYIIAGIGFCGGFTTFSTTSFETVRLLEKHEYGKAAFNALGTAIIALALAGLGIFVAVNL